MRPSCWGAGHTVVEPDLFGDLAIFDAKHRRCGETRRPPDGGRQRPSRKSPKVGPELAFWGLRGEIGLPLVIHALYRHPLVPGFDRLSGDVERFPNPG